MTVVDEHSAGAGANTGSSATPVLYRVDHRSTVSYQAPVAQARFNIRLCPYRWPGQDLRDHGLDIDPLPSRNEQVDGPYLVNTTRLSFDEPLRQLTVRSRFTVAVSPQVEPRSDHTVAQVRTDAALSRDLTVHSPTPYLFASRIVRADADIADWAAPIVRHDLPVLEVARELTAAVHEAIAYTPGASTSRTTPGEAFRAGKGVCQDQSHVMIAALRAHAIPAGYVSGYLNTRPPPGQQKLVGADAMHAWVAVWCGPDTGWVAFDPTNNRLAGVDHVTVGMGRDYADVSPIDGVFLGAAAQKLSYAVDVRQIDEAGGSQQDG